jgi:thiol-disulfide isomerase/thioredoxin
MRKSFIILALSFISTLTYSKNKGEGMEFFKGTWSELLSEAKRQNKPIFIDVYTDWCRPCKVLEKEIFPNDEVGDFYNKNFINYRFDAEKGEGIEFAKKYGVVSYPTFLYLNKESKILFTKSGVPTITELIDKGKEVLVSIANFKELTSYAESYELHKYDSDFVLEYARKLSENNLPSQSVLDMYLSKIPYEDWSRIEVLQVIGSSFSSLDSKSYDVLKNNFNFLALSREQKKSATALNNIVQVQRREKKKSIQIQDEELLDKALNLQYLIFGGWSIEGRKKLDSEIFPNIKAETKIDFYFHGKNWLKYHELCKGYIKQANLIKKIQFY